MRTVSTGEVEYGELEEAYQTARLELVMNKDIDAWIANAINLLSTAATDEQVKEGVRALIRWTGMRQLIEILYYRELITLSPGGGDSSHRSKLSISESELNGGCYYVVFADAIARLGGDFQRDPWRKQNLAPLVRAIETLDRDYLLALAEELPQHAIRERDVNQAIVDRLQPIRDDYTIWIGRCSFINYGNSPIVIWPSAKIHLREKRRWRAREIAPVTCYLAEPKQDNENDADDLHGPVVLGPGQSKILWAITSEKKKDLPDGNLLNAHFKDGSAQARVRFLITHRGVPFKTSIRSTSTTFEESSR